MTTQRVEDEHVLVHLPGHNLLLAHDIATVLADGREDSADHPVLEGTGFGFVRAHDEAVEAGAVDDPGSAPPHTLNPIVPYFIFCQRPRGHGRIAQAEDAAHVRSYEPRLPVDLDDADGVGLRSRLRSNPHRHSE